MRLPTPLLRHKPKAYKNQFGHVLILGGSQRMLGAGALASLAAVRSGAGLVTLGIPKSLNAAAHKKIDNVIMTWPLNETRSQTLSSAAYADIKKAYKKFTVIAVGPGLSRDRSTERLILRLITSSPLPLVIDADALNALNGHLKSLHKSSAAKILTPHPGEMARLCGQTRERIETNRKASASAFAKTHRCTLLLKGSQTVVAAPGKPIYTNRTGNAGMATAGSGDVLTGMIAAFVAQGLAPYEAAKYGAFVHGKAGDLAAKQKSRLAMTASDIIDFIPQTVQKLSK